MPDSANRVGAPFGWMRRRCLHVGPWMWSDTFSEVDAAGRGVHDLALDHQASAADLDRDAAALGSLLSYVAIRRLN